MDTTNVGNDVVKPMSVLAAFAGLSLLYFIGLIVYRLYFHPLHSIPGPWINALSKVPLARHTYDGTVAHEVSRLHQKYGEVVRLSPNEVSFVSGETAWQDIYGFRTGKMRGQLNMPKHRAYYPRPPKGGSSMLNANDEDHTRFRRVYAHAFSEKALSNQEVLVQQYIDLLILRLRETSIASTQPIDLAQFYNFTTFDIIADLTFGEPFGCLRDVRMHDHVNTLFSAIEFARLHYLNYHFPAFKNVLNWLFNVESVAQGRRELFAWVQATTQKRMNTETERHDFMTEVLKHNGEKGSALPERDITNNNTLLLVAGSETTASLLSGVTFCLLQNPSVLQKLKDEVRTRWQKYEDITLDQVNHAPYLLAVLQEALRFFPPAPTGFAREVAKGGAVVSGRYLPEGTCLFVPQYALAHHERNFTDPDAFIPERFMDDPRFANDKRDALQPFSFGPRNCLGKNLAYAEMRLILAKMIWSFDMELDPRCENWMAECKSMGVWVKPPLWVRLNEVVRD